jgi:SAM-dependent methyltransferase
MISCPPMIGLRGVAHESGNCWWVKLPTEIPDGDNPDYPPKSCLHLFEDGCELGPAYVWHEEIRKLGAGRYSHWGRKLYFSTSDNSSPLENGRSYCVLVNNQRPPNGEHVAPLNIVRRSPEQMNGDVNYAIELTNHYLSHLSAVGLRPEGLRFLELGPGINFAPQLVLASMGAAVTVADRFLIPWDEDYHPHFYRAFRERWGNDVPAIDLVLREGAHVAEAITGLTNPAENLADVPAASFDLVISNAVLEHVYSVPAACREMARVSAPGGLNLHQIDFRDHNNFDRPLEFLTIPDDEFDAIFTWKNGERGNRWRLSETQFAFEQVGFEPIGLETNMQVDPNYLEEFLPRLRASSSRYRDWPRNDLIAISAFLKLRKG